MSASSEEIVATMHALDDQADRLMELLHEASERERVDKITIRELLVTVKIQERDLAEANARIRAYEARG